jgi:hypothetical protein
LCCVANIVCVLDNDDVSLNDVVTEMLEVAHW